MRERFLRAGDLPDEKVTEACVDIANAAFKLPRCSLLRRELRRPFHRKEVVAPKWALKDVSVERKSIHLKRLSPPIDDPITVNENTPSSSVDIIREAVKALVVHIPKS